MLKIKRFATRNWKKAVLVAGLTGVLATGIALSNNYDILTVPLYDNVKVEAEYYGIDEHRFFAYDGMADVRTAKIVANKRYVDDIKEKINESEATYSFIYTVQKGDTISELEERFNGKIISSNPDANYVWAGELVEVFVRGPEGKKLVEEMDKIAEEKRKKEEEERLREEKEFLGMLDADSFYYYVVQPGDTVVGVADKFNVRVKDLMRYNSRIPDIYTIYAYDTIRIPVFEKQNTK